MNKQTSDRLIAATVTAVVAAIILVVLFCCGLTWDKAAIAQASIPEEQSDEEMFIEPEILEEPGEELPALEDNEAAAAQKGDPEPAPVEQKQVEVKGENPEPAPKVEKPITQTKPSPVKATEPKKSDKEPKKATDPTAGKFSSRNGNKDGKKDGNSVGKVEGTSGKMNGRKFLGCNKPSVVLSERTVVTVTVWVNAAGKVVKANASGGTADMRRKCEAAAMTARWSEKPGAADARGTITFTITPKTR